MTMPETIAIIYDFDGTLTKESSLNYTIFPYLKIKPDEFWELVNKEMQKDNADWILIFMRLVLEIAKNKKFKITQKILKKLVKNIIYVKGIPQYFERINTYINKNFKDINLRHYIISGNLAEIVKFSKVAKYMKNIFASSYYYKNGKPVFPLLAVNETLKTQFIFRISKGREKMYEPVNDFIEHSKRPVPFKNIIYIGDGLTDIPSMAVVKNNGGHSIAVYNDTDSKKVCDKLLKEGRVHFIAKADYSKGSKLEKLLKRIIALIIKNN